MLQQLTKEDLLKRVLALEDGTIIDGEIQQMLMTPDSNESMNRTWHFLSRLVCDGDSKSGINRIRYVEEPDTVRNDLVSEYVKTRENVTDVTKSSIGIKPDDLDHPIMCNGMDWYVKMAESGAFNYDCCKFIINNTEDKDVIFRDIDNWIKKHNWVHTYLYTINNINALDDAGNIVRHTNVSLCGVTEKDIEKMKNTNPTDKLTWLDYAYATGNAVSF